MSVSTWLYKFVFACVLSTVVAIAEELPTTLEGLEQYEAAHIVDESAASGRVNSDSVLKQFNLQVWHTKVACIKAVGHEKFCDCISENMPADQEFSNYVVAVSKTKNELNFDQLSEYYQQVVDLARASRDKCVKETM